MKKKKLRRVVLGEGYPWFIGTGDCTELSILDKDGMSMEIKVDGLSDQDKIRLVAEVLE